MSISENEANLLNIDEESCYTGFIGKNFKNSSDLIFENPNINNNLFHNSSQNNFNKFPQKNFYNNFNEDIFSSIPQIRDDENKYPNQINSLGEFENFYYFNKEPINLNNFSTKNNFQSENFNFFNKIKKNVHQNNLHDDLFFKEKEKVDTNFEFNHMKNISNENFELGEKFKIIKENLQENNQSQIDEILNLKNYSMNKNFQQENSTKSKSHNFNNYFGENKKTGKWSEEEDLILSELAPQYGGKNWKNIAKLIPGRSPIQCLHRWTKILQPGLKKGAWTIEEDLKLKNWVKNKGPTKWTLCSEMIQGRNGKQCRERWFNTLNPKVVKGNWSSEEDFLIFFLFKNLGGKWTTISWNIMGRTENSIKNRFYSALRKITMEKIKTENKNKKDNYSIEELLENFPVYYNKVAERYMKDYKISYDEFETIKLEILKNITLTNNNKSYIKINREINGVKELKTDNQNQNQEINLFKTKEEKINIDNLNNNLINISKENVNFSLSTENNNKYITTDNSSKTSISLGKIDFNVNDLDFDPNDIFSLEKNISEMCDNPSFINNDNFFDFNFNHKDNDFFNSPNEDNILFNKNTNLKDNFEEENFIKNAKEENKYFINSINFGENKNNLINKPETKIYNDNIEILNEIDANKRKNSTLLNNGNSNTNLKEKKNNLKNNFSKLLFQLEDLEKIVKTTKKELGKYNKKVTKNN